MNSQSGLISVFLPVLVGGGAERVMLNLANEMAKMGQSVDFVVAKAAGPYLNQISKDINLVDLKSGRTGRSLLPLARYLQQKQPVALISGLDNVNVISIFAKKLARVPTKNIITLHNTLSVKTRHARFFSRGRLIRYLVKRYYHAADEIVAVSNGVANDYLDLTGLSRERIRVIYNPVINDEMRQRAQEPLEHPWFAAGEPPVVLSVGRLSKQKNYAALIEAIAKVREQLPARLMILGEGELREELETLIRQLELSEAVELPGFVDNPYKYMANAALFALSSRWEGLPTVLIEALAVGTPVVSTNCKSGPEEILEGGVLGTLVPVDDIEALAGAIMNSLVEGAPPVSYDKLKAYEFKSAAKGYLDVVRR